MAQSKLQQLAREKRKADHSLGGIILNKLIPDNIEFNYITLLSRTSSLMIRQNSKLMAQLVKPDVLIDIQMNKYGSFDYDKSEKLIAIGHSKARQAMKKWQH
jgi:NTE family protein